MFKKKKVLAAIGIVCVVAISLSVLVYAPSPWTTQDMVDYMYNVGRHKLWQTNWILYNQIGPDVAGIKIAADQIWALTGNTHGWANISEALDDIKIEIGVIEGDITDSMLHHDLIMEKLGQGLVGEWEAHETLVPAGRSIILWTYEVPADNPKKVSFWVNLRHLTDPNQLYLRVEYDSDADGDIDGDDSRLENTATRWFERVFSGDQFPYYGKLIIDELPVSTIVQVYAGHDGADDLTLPWHFIIEEL